VSINEALLALLSNGPKSGYDLKKLVAQLDALPWSGNNNQVYPALVQLHRDGLVEQEVQPGEGPARKVYSLTADGREALRGWLISAPDVPQARSPFVARLMGADVLSDDELDGMLLAYEEELRMKLLMLEENERRGIAYESGSARQRAVWRQVHGHTAAALRAEREWLLTLQWALAKAREGEAR
jgi:DNA-binding PadR family transcriptional regulator